MNVNLLRKNDAFHIEASGASDVVVSIDNSPDGGGVDAGARPMELVLMALGGCSSMDVISILKKQRQKIDDFRVEVNGEREKEKVPAVFKKIHVKFLLAGDIEEKKLKRAIELSMNKYCSVTFMLRGSVEISHSFVLNGYR